MQKFPFEIDYYFTKEGKKPFKVWLRGLKILQQEQKYASDLTECDLEILEIIGIWEKECMNSRLIMVRVSYLLRVG
jgi:hypothetical protein